MIQVPFFRLEVFQKRAAVMNKCDETGCNLKPAVCYSHKTIGKGVGGHGGNKVERWKIEVAAVICIHVPVTDREAECKISYV